MVLRQFFLSISPGTGASPRERPHSLRKKARGFEIVPFIPHCLYCRIGLGIEHLTPCSSEDCNFLPKKTSLLWKTAEPIGRKTDESCLITHITWTSHLKWSQTINTIMAANILHPRKSLRRLRTALTSSTSSPPRSASECSTSPLSARTPSSLSGFNFGFANQSSSSLTPHSRRIIRRKRSTMEEQREEERLVMGDELVGLVEPRPSVGLANIEEILEGGI